VWNVTQSFPEAPPIDQYKQLARICRQTYEEELQALESSQAKVSPRGWLNLSILKVFEYVQLKYLIRIS
jgi:hypothetical protein